MLCVALVPRVWLAKYYDVTHVISNVTQTMLEQSHWHQTDPYHQDADEKTSKREQLKIDIVASSFQGTIRYANSSADIANNMKTLHQRTQHDPVTDHEIVSLAWSCYNRHQHQLHQDTKWPLLRAPSTAHLYGKLLARIPAGLSLLSKPPNVAARYRNVLVVGSECPRVVREYSRSRQLRSLPPRLHTILTVRNIFVSRTCAGAALL